MQAPIFTVSQLTNALKKSIESTFPLVWLQGEISNFKIQTSGHLYFTLKDSQAQISAVMFRGNAQFLSALPKDGSHVLVKGELNVYPPKGNYQIIVRELTPVGLGELLLKLEQLKNKLQALGWFDPALKKPLPRFPKKIGIVTSPTGAAIQDILNILSRRFAGVHIILNPVKVQGEGSAQEIAQAIDQFNQHNLVDVIIVGRGGGSLEDLWAFNEEVVAAAIHRSHIPIISAVGHETDTCIADYVADLRAPTPSAAAEIVISEKTHLLQQVLQAQKRLIHCFRHLLLQNRQRLENFKRQPALFSPYHFLGTWMQKIDDIRDALETSTHQLLQRKQLQLQGLQRHAHSLKPSTHVQHLKHSFNAVEKQLLQSILQKIFQRKQKLHNIHSTLLAIDPKNLLKKGYSIILSSETNTVLNSVTQINPPQPITLILSDGKWEGILSK